MKYLKFFESDFKLTEKYNLDDLSEYLVNFFKKETKLDDFKFTKNLNIYNFYIDFIFLFSFIKIDYYYGDLNIFFEINLNNQLQEKPNYDIVLFIYNIITKYSDFQKMIKFSDIEKIYSEINHKNFEMYKDTKKYNL